MDEADIAGEQEEWFRERALKLRKPVPEHDGYCMNCGAESPYSYCDADCRDDSERFELARERDGRRANYK